MAPESRVWVSAFVILLAVLAGMTIVPGGARAAVSTESMAEVFFDWFYANYKLTWNIYDCVEARLYLDDVEKSRSNYGCYDTGFELEGYLSSVFSTGTFVLQIWSNYTSSELHSRAWTLPTLALTTTLSPALSYVGDSLLVGAKLELVRGGLDSYYRSGRISISAPGQELSYDVTVDVDSSRYRSFHELPPRPDGAYFLTGAAITATSTGATTVAVQYRDPMHTLSSAAVVDATERPPSPMVQKELDDLRNRAADLQTKLDSVERENLRIGSSIPTIPVALTYSSLALAVVAVAIAIVAVRRNRSPAPPPYEGPPPGPPQ